MNHWASRFFILLALVAFVASAAAQAGSIVDKILFDGNRRVSSERLEALIQTRPGKAYSPAIVRQDFQTLWDTKDFRDIRVEVQDDPNRTNGKIVIFHLIERPAP